MLNTLLEKTRSGRMAPALPRHEADQRDEDQREHCVAPDPSPSSRPLGHEEQRDDGGREQRGT